MRDDLLQRLKLVRVHLMMLEVAASANIVTQSTCTVMHLAPLGGLLAGDAVKRLRLGGDSRLTMLVLLREKAIVCAKDGM